LLPAEAICQFCNREVVSDGLPLLLIFGPVRYDFAIANSWLPLGTKAEVTKAEGSLVHTIDGVSTVDFYRRYIGYHEQPAREFILAVYEPGAREYYLVSPVEYYDSGAARFSGIIPEGSKVQLTEVIREDLIADTRTTSKLLNSADRDWKPAFALTFSCAFRKEVLGTSAQEELNVLRGSFPSGLPVTGFYSFGEIAPLVAGGRSKAQGATLILLLIGPGPEDGYPEKRVGPEEKENAICGLIGQITFITDLTEQKKALTLAGEVQRSLLPRESPKVHGLDIAGRNVSCDEVGGDYYDFFLQQENVGHSFSVAVGDITGHGVDAALLMTSARAFLRMHASRDESIVEIVRLMNRVS
jgi:hypothetical protein